MLGQAGPCWGGPAEATAASSPSFRQCSVTLPASRANPEKLNLVINNHNGIERRFQNGIAVPTELTEPPKGANALVLKKDVQDAACLQLTRTDALWVCRGGFIHVRSTRRDDFSHNQAREAPQRGGRGGDGVGSARCSIWGPGTSSSTNLTWKTGWLGKIVLVLELLLGKQQSLLKFGKCVLQAGEKHKTALLPCNSWRRAGMAAEKSSISWAGTLRGKRLRGTWVGAGP